MKFVWALFFSSLVLGSECIDWNGVRSQVLLNMETVYNDYVSPVQFRANELAGLYRQARTKIVRDGPMSLTSSDDCLAITGTLETAYEQVFNMTEFATQSVSILERDFTSMVNCSNAKLVDQLSCIYNCIKVIRQDIDQIKLNFVPLRNESVVIYETLVSEIQKCVG